jgi:hypothetical protein
MCWCAQVVKENKFRLVEEYDDKTKDNKISIPETPLTPVSGVRPNIVSKETYYSVKRDLL